MPPPIDYSQPPHLVRRALFAEFDALGEATVRAGVVSGAYKNQRLAFAIDWLDERDAAKETREREIDRAVAREANDIARAAKASSDRANIIAGAALVISILVATVTIVQMLR